MRRIVRTPITGLVILAICVALTAAFGTAIAFAFIGGSLATVTGLIYIDRV